MSLKFQLNDEKDEKEFGKFCFTPRGYGKITTHGLNLANLHWEANINISNEVWTFLASTILMRTKFISLSSKRPILKDILLSWRLSNNSVYFIFWRMKSFEPNSKQKSPARTTKLLFTQNIEISHHLKITLCIKINETVKCFQIAYL